MPPVDDDAGLIYSQGRANDVKLEEEVLAEEDFQSLVSRAAPAAPPTPEDPAAPAPDAASSPADGIDDTQLSSEDPNLIPETTPDPTIDVAPSGESEPTSSFRSIATHMRNAPIGEAADFADNALEWMVEGLNVLGVEDADTFNRDARGRWEPILRPMFDKAAGKPDTAGEEIAAGLVGQLAYIVPAMSVVKGAKVFGAATKTRTAATLIGAPAVVAAATLGQGEGTLSNLAVEQGGVWDNAITQALAIDADDSVIERMLKAAAEDSILGITMEGVGAVTRAAVFRYRGWRSKKRAIAEVVENTGRDADGELISVLDDVETARGQVAMLDAAVDEIDKGKAALDLEDEAAAFAGKSTSREGLSADEIALFDEIEAATRAKAHQARKLLEESEARAVLAAGTTAADGQWIEAVRRAADNGDSSNAVNRALAKAANANKSLELPKKRILDNFLEVDEADMVLVKSLIDEGDLDEAAVAMGKIFDNKNYDRILSEDGGLERVLKIFAQTFGNTKSGNRGGNQVLTFADTEERALEMIAQIADEKGTSLEAVIGGIDNLMGDVDDLTVKFNALRMAEVTLAEQFNKIAGAQGTADWGDLGRAELMRTGTLLANLNDRIAGISSEFGRGLGSHRIAAKSDTFTETLESARRLRNEQVNSIVDMHGGRANIDRIAEAVRVGGDAKTTSKILESAFAGPTLGDTFYNAFVTNILSSPSTQIINIGSNLGKVFLWNYPVKLIEAGAVSIRNGNLDGFRQWQQYVTATGRAAAAAVGVGGAWRDSTVRQAWHTGRRVTAGDAVKFAGEAGADGALFRRNKVGDLVRRGVPIHVPLSGTGLFGKENKVVRPLFALPDGMRNGLADYIQTRSGLGAKAWDFTARVMELPTKALAAGDELAAAINYRGTLEADALGQVQKMGLEGAEAEDMLARIIRDAPNVESIAKRADLTDADRQNYIRMLDRLNIGASDAARVGTFTEPSGKAADLFLEARQIFPAIRWFAPFVRTPMNLLKAGVRDFNPVGQGVQAVGTGLQKGFKSEEFAEAAARTAAVSGLFYGLYQKIEDGTIQGGGPHDPAQRAIWLEERNPDGTRKNLPYSVNVPGLGRVAYNRFDPISMPLGIMADMVYLMDNMPPGSSFDEELLPELVNIMKEQLKSRSYLEGISNMLHMTEDFSRYGRRMLISNVENTILPGSRFWAGLERGGLPIPDDLVANLSDEGASGLLKDFVKGRPEKEIIQGEQPGLSGMFLQLGSTLQADLPAGGREVLEAFWSKVITKMGVNDLASAPQRNFYGDIRTTPPTLGPQLASPFITSDTSVELDNVSSELVKIGYGVSVNKQFGEVMGVKLTPKQQDKFQQLFATPHNQPTIREVLAKKIFERDGVTPKRSWANRGDDVEAVTGEGKIQVVRKVVGRRRQAALRRLRQEDPELDAVLERVEKNNRLKKTKEGTDLLTARQSAGEDLTTSATFAKSRVDDPFDGALNE